MRLSLQKSANFELWNTRKYSISANKTPLPLSQVHRTQIYFILYISGGQETNIFKTHPMKRKFYNELHAKRVLYNKAISLSPW